MGAGSTIAIGSDLAVNPVPPSFDIGTVSFATGAGSYTINNVGFTLDFTGTGISNSTANTQTFSNGGTINFKNSASARDIASPGVGTIAISNEGTLNFLDTSTAGGAVITNTGTLILGDTASGGSASISNGGILDLSGNTEDNITFEVVPGTAGPQTLGSLTNTNNLVGGDPGFIKLGKKTLTVGNVTLASGLGTQSINFTLDEPGASSGKIVLTPLSTFSGSLNGEVDINLSSFGPVTPGTYTLIDWTGSTASGVNIEDFVLDTDNLPAGLLPSSHLIINGSTLQLVAVPEPSSLMMPVAAVLGMVWMRRRAARATV